MTAKIHRKSLLALATLVALVGALPAPAARADFAFEPGTVFAKAHPPVQHDTSSLGCEPFQCVFFGPSQYWVEDIENAPELTQAGGHPDFSVSFRLENAGIVGREVEAGHVGGGHVRTILTDAPAGAVGNPLSVPRCESADFHLTYAGACPSESQVGSAVTLVELFSPRDLQFYSPVSSLVPAPGQPALIGFKSFAYTTMLIPEVRSESDYGLRFNVDPIPNPLTPVEGNTLTFWGVPHDPVHDPQRFNDVGALSGDVGGTPVPFLSAPTNCSTGPVDFTTKTRTWEDPERWLEEISTASEPTGCDQIEFNPGISAAPSTNVADSPTGLEVDVHTPQHEGCQLIPESEAEEEEMLENGESLYDCGLATSHLKDTVVKLPAGLAVNPSGANGLEGCTTAQIGLTTPHGVSPQQFTKAVPSCPESSRIAGVEIDTPLLDAPMPGSVYIAKPYDNPFGSLLAIYIVANDEERGLIVKLAGKVEADPVTGQLTTTVTNAPQLPFSHFLLHFKQGPHATLRTPGTCGNYTSTAALTPYSAPGTAFDRQDEWSISQGPNRGCALPNAPTLDAGSVTPLAGASTPTVVNLSRADGSQEFSTVDLTLPPGLTGKLAGVGQCPGSALAAAEAKSGHDEEANPSCPANSRIGTVYVAAGAGPAPYNTTASAYLAGPYKGAPLSMAIVAPAAAGPFDLGTVVVRVALRLDQNTGQITAESDPIPHILKGIPLDVRSTRIVIDRPDFTRNGTSCDPSAFSGQEVSTLSQAASLSDRFQLAECSSLGFKPKLAIRLFGSTKRGGHPALRGVVRMPEGGANVAQASVALPHSEFLDQGHIGTVCTRVQFAGGDGNGSACPPASIYGKATATSPLVDYALQGNAILRSSSHKLPDLVVALHGPPSQPVAVDVVGRVDSLNGGIRTTFEGVPDLPVSSFVLSMKGGKKGLLQNSTDICQGTHKATVVFDAQNGKSADLAPALRNGKCGKAHKKHKRHNHRPALRRLRAAR